MAHEHDHLPFFASPMVRRESGTDYGHSFRRTSRGRAQTLSLGNIDDLADIDLSEKDSFQTLSPVFKKHTEATHSELFYDLFFVANLAVFSTVKEVNDGTTLSQYCGFFSILWFTWYQVSLYDVRFSMDSIFDRIAKAVQFGVMIGFAICGPTFDVGEKLEVIMGVSGDEDIDQIANPDLAAFKALTLIMAGSRFVLVLQYLQAMWLARKQKETLFPMALISATELVAAMVYLILYFAFQGLHANAYITWYVVALLETGICTAVSSIWRCIGFKGTHLVQRMSLLTLIILGEGIILLARTCQNIVKGQIFGFASSTVCNITSCVLIIYFLYMLYFDWIQEGHMGTIRQQLWAFLHFPLHLALVLSLHGAAQFIAWRAATVRVNALLNEVLTWDYSSPSSHDFAAQGIQATVNEIIEGSMRGSKSLATTLHFAKANDTAYAGLAVIKAKDWTADSAWSATNMVYNTLINAVYASVGFNAPDAGVAKSLVADEAVTAEGAGGARSGQAAMDEIMLENHEIYRVAALVFVYFFVCLGFFVMLVGLVAWIAKREKDLADRIRLGTNFVMGAVLCLVATTAAEIGVGEGSKFAAFVYSPWILPTAMVCLFIVVLLDNVRLPGSPAEVRRLVRRPFGKRARRIRHSF